MPVPYQIEKEISRKDSWPVLNDDAMSEAAFDDDELIRDCEALMRPGRRKSYSCY